MFCEDGNGGLGRARCPEDEQSRGERQSGLFGRQCERISFLIRFEVISEFQLGDRLF